MKNYSKEIAIGVLLALSIVGATFWFVSHESDNILQMGVALITIVLAVGAFIRHLAKKNKIIESGEPETDEFTNMAKLHAGSKAFLYSFWFWFLIFVFNSQFSDREEMLGVGILGSAAIYGVLYWYYKNNPKFDE